MTSSAGLLPSLVRPLGTRRQHAVSPRLSLPPTPFALSNPFTNLVTPPLTKLHEEPHIPLFSLFHTACALSQVMDTKYFSNKNLQREVPASRAKYVQIVTKNPDGSITTEVTDIARNEVINSQTYKGEEPTGVWKYRGGSIFDKQEHVYVMDYAFDLKYADAACTDTIAGLRDFSKDNASLKYTAPKIAGEHKNLSDFLVHNIYYPDAAREGGNQGKVLLTLKINATGSIEQVVVKKKE